MNNSLRVPRTEDLRIRSIRDVVTPAMLHEAYPISEKSADLVCLTRDKIHHILNQRDDRILVVTGPCSIHDPQAALDYARRLSRLRQEFEKDLLIIMRVYFEKPRTTIGWKGLINDPDLDDSFNINKGLRIARQLLLDLNDMGVPAGTEFLDIITPQYIADLISWGAIGARTTESQLHRELASGLSCPIGFKNGTQGDIKIAADAVISARNAHRFLTMTQQARSSIFETMGNPDSHIILRGGKQPNFDSASVASACEILQSVGLEQNLMIDFSHANSQKDPQKQLKVCDNVSQQISEGNHNIFGVMIESHLKEGKQNVVSDQPLEYGKSITDGCISLEKTELMLTSLAEAVRKRRTKPKLHMVSNA